MLPTQVSLKQHYNDLVLKDYQVRRHETFPQYQDFQTFEKYYGECPLIFSFDVFYQENQGWMQLMDGYLFLVPLLYSNQSIKPNTILPRLALNILPAHMQGFHYSTYSYASNAVSTLNEVYVFMEYYEGLTHINTLQRNLDRVTALCSEYGAVKFIMNSFLGATGKDHNLSTLLEGIRKLPANCAILSVLDFSEVLNLKGSKVIFLYDEDVLTHSVWEEMAIIRNGVVSREKISKLDSVVQSFDVYPQVKRDIYFHQPTKPALEAFKEKELKKIVSLIKDSTELLDHNYRRLIRDIIEN